MTDPRLLRFQETGENTANRRDNPGLAFLFILGSSFGFALTNTFVKELGTAYSSMQTVFFRTSLNFLILLPFWIFLPYKGRPAIGRLSPTWQNTRVLLTRSIAGFLALCCYFFAIPRLPLSISSLLYNLSPAFVLLFSRVFLKELVPPHVKIGGITAFIGLCLLLKIWVELSPLGVLVTEYWGHWGRLGLSGFSGISENSNPGILILVFSAIAVLGSAFAGAAQLAVRAATAHVGAITVVLFFTGISALLSFPFAIANWTPVHREDVWKLILLGVISGISQLLMTAGYRAASAGYVSVLMLMNVPFSLAIGYLYFGEILEPIQYLGMILLLLSLSGLALVAAEKRRKE